MRTVILRWLHSGQQGFALVESVVAIGIIATILSVSIAGVSNVTRGALLSDRGATADMLARSQMEAIKTEPYVPPPGTYPTIAAPSGYAVTVETFNVPGADANIELVRVTVSNGGQSVGFVEGYKVRR